MRSTPVRTNTKESIQLLVDVTHLYVRGLGGMLGIQLSVLKQETTKLTERYMTWPGRAGFFNNDSLQASSQPVGINLYPCSSNLGCEHRQNKEISMSLQSHYGGQERKFLLLLIGPKHSFDFLRGPSLL